MLISLSQVLERNKIVLLIEQSVQLYLQVAVLGDERHAWRIKYNVTGTALTASSGDGTVRVWKAMFVNQWALLAEMSSEDYLEERELLKVKGVLSETGRGDGEAYHRRTYY
ncbi:hypothetical protein ANCCAN_01142 [Ancylostoma caninum]|uniref:WD domain, G-beta repeat protein n=1 Tax=Ancylostoma caninum TaxID=29170 RepID=A0A368HBZ4_ANCCA|nr:hypothetical protein ANCCAN_01142 [Ancylostoma caninum]